MTMGGPSTMTDGGSQQVPAQVPGSSRSKLLLYPVLQGKGPSRGLRLPLV